MRKLIQIKAGISIDLREFGIDLTMISIKRLWTVFDKDKLWESPHQNQFMNCKPKYIEELNLKHLSGIFLEEKIHDYQIIDKYFLHYYSRVVETGRCIDLILELNPIIEIEKKYLISEMPSNCYIIKEEMIEQTYLSISEDKEERVRYSNENGDKKFTHTIKIGSGLARQEIEKNISNQKYQSFLIPEKTPLIKKRISIIEDNQLFELDVYQNYINDLIVAEIEFDSMISANKFVPPTWFGEDVTDNKEFKNKNLWKKIQ